MHGLTNVMHMTNWLTRARKRRLMRLIFTDWTDGLTSTPVSSVERQATLRIAAKRSEMCARCYIQIVKLMLRAYLFILDSASMGHFHILAFVPLTLLVTRRVKYNHNVRSLGTLRV